MPFDCDRAFSSGDGPNDIDESETKSLSHRFKLDSSEPNGSQALPTSATRTGPIIIDLTAEGVSIQPPQDENKRSPVPQAQDFRKSQPSKRPLSATEPFENGLLEPNRYGFRARGAQPSYKRKRGRPRLYAPLPPSPAKPRGRPRLYGPLPPSPAKPRGRPRKYPPDDGRVASAQKTVGTFKIGRFLEAAVSPGISVAASPKTTATKLDLQASYAWMAKHMENKFVQQLSRRSPEITIVNSIDDDSPPDFRLIDSYKFREGTMPLDKDACYGCQCRTSTSLIQDCKEAACDCLADCAADEDGELLGFPYAASSQDGKQLWCLRPEYLDYRHVIYECNELCKCGDDCSNKVVGKGRQLRLEIFKTKNRGWGLRCHENIKRGQFVEVYLGEVVTDSEAKRREQISTIQKNSYLFSLDKFFRGDEAKLDSTLLHVVDGERQGSVTRFINHSCDPNLRVFAVSFYHGDPRIYQLGFFASRNISKGTELTFDYLDKDSDDDDDDDYDYIDDNSKESEGRAKCQCGASNCRNWLWI